MKKVINIKSRCRSPGLLSRIIWQELFSEYRRGNGDLGNMDSLLCDLIAISAVIQSSRATIEHKAKDVVKFFWRFDREYTDIITYASTDTDYYCINIDFIHDEIEISK